MRHLLPAPPQPLSDLQTKVSFLSISVLRKRPGSRSCCEPSSSSLSASRQIPSAPTVPGLGGTITSLPVCRATAAASASEEKGIPWQKITSPTERLPFTRLR